MGGVEEKVGGPRGLVAGGCRWRSHSGAEEDLLAERFYDPFRDTRVHPGQAGDLIYPGLLKIP
jgi:hypothetical protein